MHLGCFFLMSHGMHCVAVSDVGMLGGFMGLSPFMKLCCFMVMSSCFFVVLRRQFVMLVDC